MKRLRLLLVEDKPAVLKLIATLLEASYDMTATTDGNAALALIGHDRFDVVVKYLRIPGVGGIDLSSAVGGYAPRTAVVVITAFANAADAAVAIGKAARRGGMTGESLHRVLRRYGVPSEESRDVPRAQGLK